MGIYQDIESKYKESMKARDKTTVDALRMLISEIKYDMMEGRHSAPRNTAPDDEAVTGSLRKALKKRTDSLNIYSEHKRDDLASKEKSEIDMISTFLPAEMEEAALLELVKKIIDENEIKDRSGMGHAMKLVMAEVAGRASGSTVSTLVKKELA